MKLVEERLDELEKRYDSIEERLDNIEKNGVKKKRTRSGESPPGICVVTGKPSGEDCEHWSTYRYQNGCQGACLEKGREYYRQYYFDRNHK